MNRVGYLRRVAPAVRPGVACWEWPGARSGNGYGRLLYEGRDTYAHRVAWEIACGPIPDGMHILHRCDNPPCVRPDHLSLGTHADNMADMSRKGRSSSGARNGHARLTWEDAAEIRAAVSRKEPQAAIAARFGVSVPTVSEIGSGKAWKIDGASVPSGSDGAA